MVYSLRIGRQLHPLRGDLTLRLDMPYSPSLGRILLVLDLYG